MTTAQETEAVRSLLMELRVTVPALLKILSDNLGATFVAHNPLCHLKLKHVAMDLHFVRERTENGYLAVLHIPGKDQWADILTKALPPKAFLALQCKIVGDLPQD